MRVFLDDLRRIDQSHNENKGLGNLDFTIVRNDVDFYEIIDNPLDKIELISFDHDLACYRDWETDRKSVV